MKKNEIVDLKSGEKRIYLVILFDESNKEYKYIQHNNLFEFLKCNDYVYNAHIFKYDFSAYSYNFNVLKSENKHIFKSNLTYFDINVTTKKETELIDYLDINGYLYFYKGDE